VAKVGSIAQIRALLFISFLTMLGFAAVLNIGLLTKDTLGWDAAATGSIFVLVGITDILVQGVLLQRLLKRFSEAQVAIAGMVGEAIGLILIGSIVFVHSAVPLFMGTIIFAMGDGLFGPALNGLLSRGVDASAQGQVQGGNQAVQSVARIIGPLAAGEMYDRLGHSTPYLGGSVIAVMAIAVLSMALPTLNRTAKPAESPSA